MNPLLPTSCRGWGECGTAQTPPLTRRLLLPPRAQGVHEAAAPSKQAFPQRAPLSTRISGEMSAIGDESEKHPILGGGDANDVSSVRRNRLQAITAGVHRVRDAAVSLHSGSR